MAGISKAISDKLYNRAKDDLKECAREGEVSRKLQAIKSAKDYGITLVAKIYGVSRLSIMNWIKGYESLGIEGLKIKAGRGRKPTINQEEQEIIRVWLEENNRISIKEVKLRIHRELGKTIQKSAVHELMKKLGFSYITPRPKHYKQVKEKQEEFKKKSPKNNSIKST